MPGGSFRPALQSRKGQTMARIKIKQLGDVVATAGLHLGGGPERRKLEPGEVVEISEDEMTEDGRSLLEIAFGTQKVEITLDEPTRPLDYRDYREATLCRPLFKPRDSSEERDMLEARARVQARLQQQAVDEEVTAGLDEQPARKPVTRAHKQKSPANPRVRRRAAIQATANGKETIT